LADTYKYCSPTRGSFLSGRLPYKLDATRCNIIPWTLLDGLDLKYELIPQKLKKAGCAYPSLAAGGRAFCSEVLRG
jgi:hypothetical protein